jgi:hypothetical protein
MHRFSSDNVAYGVPLFLTSKWGSRHCAWLDPKGMWMTFRRDEIAPTAIELFDSMLHNFSPIGATSKRRSHACHAPQWSQFDGPIGPTSGIGSYASSARSIAVGIHRTVGVDGDRGDLPVREPHCGAVRSVTNELAPPTNVRTWSGLFADGLPNRRTASPASRLTWHASEICWRGAGPITLMSAIWNAASK